MGMKRMKGFERFLIDNGLVFEINRKVLHPLGLALIIDVSNDSRKRLTIAGLMESDDDEGFLFDEETFKHGTEQFEKFMKSYGDKRVMERRLKLGYLIQEGIEDGNK
jgi:hypothetical protein